MDPAVLADDPGGLGDWQTWAALALVGTTLALLCLRAFRKGSRTKKGGCGDCGGKSCGD
jgi:hypothetical protein